LTTAAPSQVTSPPASYAQSSTCTKPETQSSLVQVTTTSSPTRISAPAPGDVTAMLEMPQAAVGTGVWPHFSQRQCTSVFEFVVARQSPSFQTALYWVIMTQSSPVDPQPLGSPASQFR